MARCAVTILAELVELTTAIRASVDKVNGTGEGMLSSLEENRLVL
jgi:hypothetical protein